MKSALAILQKGHLWFTERAHLNDPIEVRYGLDVAHKLFKKSANIRNERIPNEAARHLKGEHHFGLSYYGFWTASFSLDCDDLGQWRSYADDGRGVCLGFSNQKFDMTYLASLLPNAPNSLRFPVNYDKSLLCSRLKPYIDRGLDLLEDANLPARESYHEPYGRALLYERDLFGILNEGFYANALLFKHPAYEHEQEYRLAVSGPHQRISTCEHHCLRERRGEIVGYLDLPIPGWKQPGTLTDIRLGPAAPDEVMGQIRRALTTLGMPIPKICKSDVPYRSTR